MTLNLTVCDAVLTGSKFFSSPRQFEGEKVFESGHSRSFALKVSGSPLVFTRTPQPPIHYGDYVVGIFERIFAKE